MRNLRAIRFVLYYTMGLNILVTVVKLVIGYNTGSLSLVADGFDSLFDGASNIVGLVGVYIASRPPDESHPYGHRKYETLSAVAISILLFVTTIELIQSAVERLRHPVVPQVNVWTFVALLISILVHVYVSMYERRRGRELHSEVLLADAKHTQADVLVSISVAVGMVFVRLGYPVVDAGLALLIAVFIGKIGVDIIRDSTKVLVDAAAVDEERVKQIVSQVPGVLTLHRIRSRGQDDNAYLDLHVRVAQGTPVEQAHHVAHRVQRALLAEIPGLRDAVIHVEPQEAPPLGDQHLERRIREIAGRVPEIAVHAIRVLDLQGALHVTLHMEVQESLSIEDAHRLASQVEDMLRTEVPGVAKAEVHVEPAHLSEAGSDVDEATYQQVRGALDEATRGTTLHGYHDMLVSRLGDGLHVSAHWQCEPGLSVEEAHSLASRLEERVRAALPQVSRCVVHIEPAPTDPAGVAPTA